MSEFEIFCLPCSNEWFNNDSAIFVTPTIFKDNSAIFVNSAIFKDYNQRTHLTSCWSVKLSQSRLYIVQLAYSSSSSSHGMAMSLCWSWLKFCSLSKNTKQKINLVKLFHKLIMNNNKMIILYKCEHQLERFYFTS